MTRPMVGITTDLIARNERETAVCTTAYCDAVRRGGGVPVLLAPVFDTVEDVVGRFDAFVFTGGDDPRTEEFGAPTDPRITPVFPRRQAFEATLLARLRDEYPETPLLGVCLGMQMLALTRGGRLDQYMPDTTPTHADHWDHDHAITSADESVLASGVVHSRHKQAVGDAGALRVIATAHDGVIEAVEDPSAPFCLGVQWHPERTGDEALGDGLFARLVDAAR